MSAVILSRGCMKDVPICSVTVINYKEFWVNIPILLNVLVEMNKGLKGINY